VLVEVHAALHRHVAEHVARAEPLVDVVVQAPRPAARVGPAVADEDALGGGAPEAPRAVALAWWPAA
jgi:hypothetical protein